MFPVFKPGILVLVLAFFLISCKRNTDCYATVICKDTNGNLLNNVKVELFSCVKKADSINSDSVSSVSAISNELGKVSFPFKRPALYKILATKNGEAGSVLVQLQEGKEVQKDVIIQ